MNALSPSASSSDQLIDSNLLSSAQYIHKGRALVRGR
jgi:hypothetical protein